MNIRRVIALVGFSISLLLMFGWVYLAFVPGYADPSSRHYEFWARDGTKIEVKDGELINLTAGFSTRANPNKPVYDTVIVGGLFLIAIVSSALLLASTREPKPAAVEGKPVA